MLAAIEINIRQRFAYDVTPLGSDALHLIQTRGPYAAVVAHRTVPGLDGVDLLARVGEVSPDTVRIMLVDMASRLKETNELAGLVPPAPEPDLSSIVEPALASSPSVEPISFEDFLSGGAAGSTATATATGSGSGVASSPERTEETPDNQDLLAIFDDAIGTGADGDASGSAGETFPSPVRRSVDDSTEIPTVKIEPSDLPAVDTSAGSSVAAPSSVSIADMLAGGGDNGAGGFERELTLPYRR